MTTIPVESNRVIRKNDSDSEGDKTVVSVGVFDSFKNLESMQQEWDAFVESANGDIFLTYDWCRIWWQFYGKGRQLKIFLFRSNNKLVGLLPLFLDKIRVGPVVVRVLRIVGSDSTLSQFSIPILPDHLKNIMEAFFKRIHHDNWDILHMGPIAGLYENYENLKSACEESFGQSYLVRSLNSNVQTYFKLTGTWDGYLAGLSRNGRRNFVRNYNALGRVFDVESPTLRADFANEKSFKKIFDGFVAMHKQNWQNQGKAGHFGDWPNAYEFHLELAMTQMAKNRLRLMVSRLGEHTLGYEYAFKFGNKYYAFLNVRSDAGKLGHIGLGQILFGEQIKKAMSENVRYIDAMRGKYEHKLRMGGELFPINSLLIYSNEITVLTRILLLRGLAWLLDRFYYKIWFSRIAPKLPLKRRPLWKIWIRSNMFAGH